MESPPKENEEEVSSFKESLCRLNSGRENLPATLLPSTMTSSSATISQTKVEPTVSLKLLFSDGKTQRIKLKKVRKKIIEKNIKNN